MTTLQSAPARLLGQFAWPVDQPNVGFEVALGGGGIGTFLTTLVVGAILVAFAPDWTRAKMQSVVDEPVGSFAYGVVCLLFFALVILVLFITIIGILIAFPFAIVLAFVWAVGAAIAYLAIADRFVDTDDDWLVPLLLAAGMNGALTLTGIGGIVSFCVGAAGFGAVLKDYLG
jgi:hypothetical protein